MQTELAQVEGASVEDVQRELDRQWRLAREDDSTREILREQGFDLAALDAVGDNPLEAERKGGNRADLATMIVVGIAVKIGSDIGSKAVTALWEKVVWPHLQKRFGKHAPGGPPAV